MTKKRKILSITLVLIFIVCSLSLTFTNDRIYNGDQPSRRKHPSILNSPTVRLLESPQSSAPLVQISDESDLITLASSGNGSVQSPYILENFNLDGVGTAECIGIENIDLHVKIRNSILTNGLVGVSLNSISNITLENLTITNCHKGIDIYDAADTTITNCSISDSSQCAIFILFSQDLIIDSNQISRSDSDGLFFGFSDSIHLIGNIISNCADSGLFLDGSNNIIENNQFLQCGIKIASQDKTKLISYTVSSSNTVNGKPILYFKNVEYVSISEEAGQIFLINSNHSTISDVDCSQNTVGISLHFSNNISISNVSANHNGFNGVYVFFSNNISFQKCEFSYNSFNGISVTDSPNLIIEHTSLIENQKNGGYIQYSDNIRLSLNTIDSNGLSGIVVDNANNTMINSNHLYWNAVSGIELEKVNYSSIALNILFENQDGMSLIDSHNNFLERNIISNTDQIVLSFDYGTSSNTIFSNDFLNFENKILIFSDNGSNDWSESGADLGNYYSDYLMKYSDQNSEGYYETAYQIGGTTGAQDNRPQIEQFSEPPQSINFTITYDEELRKISLSWELNEEIIEYYIYRSLDESSIPLDPVHLVGTTTSPSFEEFLAVSINPNDLKYTVIGINASGASNTIIISPNVQIADDTSSSTPTDSNPDNSPPFPWVSLLSTIIGLPTAIGTILALYDRLTRKRHLDKIQVFPIIKPEEDLVMITVYIKNSQEKFALKNVELATPDLKSISYVKNTENYQMKNGKWDLEDFDCKEKKKITLFYNFVCSTTEPFHANILFNIGKKKKKYLRKSGPISLENIFKDLQ